MTANELITGHITPLGIADTGLFALAQMEEMRVTHLPVVDDELLIGVISEKDILSMEDPEQEIGSGAMLQKRCFVTGGLHLLEVLRMFTTFNLTVLPVVHPDHRYAGSIILPALLKALSDLAGSNQPGGILVLEVPEKDFELSGLIQVAEANDAKITACMVTPDPGTGRTTVTLKVNRMDIGPLLQAFFRLDYLVTASWSEEDSYGDDLRERYDALMNFLNI